MNRHFQLIIVVLFLFILPSCHTEPVASSLKLWYDRPAEDWNEALPIGNGRMGAMIYGGVHRELLQLNDNTLYSGEPSQNYKNVNISSGFDKVMELLKHNKNDVADEYIMQNWLGRLHANYQPLGDLFFLCDHPGEIKEYRRELDIANSLLKVSYSSEGVKYSREIFASHPDSIIVIVFKATQPVLNIRAGFNSVHPTAYTTAENNTLILKGQAPGYSQRRTHEQIELWNNQHKHPELYDDNGTRKFDKQNLYGDEINGLGTFFEAHLKAGIRKGKYEVNDKFIEITDAKEVVFILTTATSFNGFDKSPSREGLNPGIIADRILGKASLIPLKKLRKNHLNDYKSLFKRVTLNINTLVDYSEIATDRRIEEFGINNDNDLAALLFQYGRYLMISGSRKGGQPLNLQGIWNNMVIPPWNCGYTININTEMNYWPAEVTNLPECHEPLFQMIKEMAVNGKETAELMYNRRGWVAHHNVSIWRETFPNDGHPSASFWNMSSGWLLSHMWEHFLFSGDTAFLIQEAFPLMREASLFYADWLMEDPKGYLITAANNSPENRFYTPEGKSASVSSGPTMDIAIIRELFTRTTEVAQLVENENNLINELTEKLKLLPPYRIGRAGQLQEWQQDYKEVEPQHRHLSHLYGLHPGNQIDRITTPDLFKAAKKTLLLRGDEASGWSMGWKINFWARMFDGNHAFKLICNLFTPVGLSEIQYSGGGLYKNMLVAHPPFQIDGNFGYTAGIAEMLVQSHSGAIHLLPALPDNWPSGKINGLRTRGGFIIDMEWEKGKLKTAEIYSTLGGNCRLRTNTPVKVKNAVSTTPENDNPNTFFRSIDPGIPVNEYDALPEDIMDFYFLSIDFKTEKDKKYSIICSSD